MRSFTLSAASGAFFLLILSHPGLAQSASANSAPPATVAVEPQDTPEAKLAIVLRSYTLVRDENDQLKAEKEKLLAEKSSLEAQLGVTKDALPLADQAAGFREQLRRMQDQLAALSLENNQLKTRLALSGPAPGTTAPAAAASGDTMVPNAITPKFDKLPEPAPVHAAAPRTHVVASGDTLMKISKKYYGTPDRWTEIFVANPDVLKDERSLVIGKTLRIP
ncbi:MAG: Peptidoglycan-binding LysM [Verrucomicrobia bacterium]|nr:Peptidoglycan-binding LysM [Verrucomicrobiota bacterium]